MKAGVLQFFSWPDRRIPLEQVYERAFERIAIMDTSGYDAVWLAEHHFSSFSICPSIHLMGTHVAARTNRLRIGTGVSLAPFYNPLRLAEEIALLDVLSGGRVNWGVGRGYQSGEFKAFGVKPDESYDVFREHVEAVVGAWTNERLTYEGRHFSCHDVEVLPKPAQKPHPPIWLAASSPESIEWAAKSGYSVLFDPHSSPDRIAEKHRLYRETLAEHGHSIDGRELPMARLLAIAPTRSAAEEIARQGAAWTVGSHSKGGVRPAEAKSARNRERPDLTIHRFFEGDAAVERYLREVIIWGTPEEVIDEIERLKEEMSLGYLMCAPLSHSSFIHFTEDVLPHVA